MPIQHLPYYLVNNIIHMFTYVFFILYPFKNKLNHSFQKTMFGLVLYTVFVCSSIMLFFEKEAPYPQYGIPALIILVIISIISSMILLRGSFFHLVFLILVMFNIQNNIVTIAKIIDLFDIFPHFIKFEYANYLITTIGVLILYLPAIWYIYIKLFKKIIDMNIDFSYGKYLCLIPLFSLIFLHTNWFSELYDASTNNSNELRNLFSLVFLNMMCILSYIISVRMLINSHENLELLSRTRLMEKQLELQKGEYERLLENIKETAKQRHDWRHHFLTISGLIQNKKYELLESYISDYMKIHLAQEQASICNNTIVDIILRHFISHAKEADIEITTEVNIPNGLAIPDLELCVVFGNLIENALEACALQKSGHRFIKLKATALGEQLFIFIQNSFFLPPKQIGEVFYSTKHSGEGMGISSVKSIVETNGGGFIININNNIFTVDVLLNTT